MRSLEDIFCCCYFVFQFYVTFEEDTEIANGVYALLLNMQNSLSDGVFLKSNYHNYNELRLHTAELNVKFLTD